MYVEFRAHRTAEIQRRRHHHPTQLIFFMLNGPSVFGGKKKNADLKLNLMQRGAPRIEHAPNLQCLNCSPTETDTAKSQEADDCENYEYNCASQHRSTTPDPSQSIHCARFAT